MAQDALDAADADAVPLGQFSLWCTGTAVCQQLADDLLAQPVGEPPASASRKRGSGAVVVERDMGDRLGSMRHYVPNIRVRVEAHKAALRRDLVALTRTLRVEGIRVGVLLVFVLSMEFCAKNLGRPNSGDPVPCSRGSVTTWPPRVVTP